MRAFVFALWYLLTSCWYANPVRILQGCHTITLSCSAALWELRYAVVRMHRFEMDAILTLIGCAAAIDFGISRLIQYHFATYDITYDVPSRIWDNATSHPCASHASVLHPLTAATWLSLRDVWPSHWPSRAESQHLGLDTSFVWVMDCLACCGDSCC